MTKEQTIEALKTAIAGLNEMTIINGNDRKLVENFNKATDILERELSKLLNCEQNPEECDARDDAQ